MKNGSLADFIFSVEGRPLWSDRVRIILEVARGILYLHEDCEPHIIHCDIKPQNILIDEFWTAKISDFGLAMLLTPNQTRTFTGPRGTRGYLAPEWYQNKPISVKADIYSLGIVLLEIAMIILPLPSSFIPRQNPSPTFLPLFSSSNLNVTHDPQIPVYRSWSSKNYLLKRLPDHLITK
ncbi:G-type lectin S-receptor-like serine/threonine-protein kinase LECRK1 [Cinnamomum micranthum f. kanehirae]|uniref:non-specific serine/threonine protein kinase n=1 Tax=Cinnamomum micranthum f. kanehirae TaxID=337451 RepID=A0A3S3PU49_9MAGN|nr:G-type lectin S-receptor-like serine/threonine-protein kinase LECRK1 [Cinnamomum micranthum f. kanehirae]